MALTGYLVAKEGDRTSLLNDRETFNSQTSAGTVTPCVLIPKLPFSGFIKVVSLDTSAGAAIGMDISKKHIYEEEFVRVYDLFAAKPDNQRFKHDPGIEVRIRMSPHSLLVDAEYEETVRHIVPEATSHELVTLQHAADSKNLQEFARLSRSIKWFRYPAAELARAIDLALMLDMVQVARELARKGRKLFPRDKRIQQAASVLSPPFFVRTSPARTTNVELSQQWFREHSSRYKGEWVAVRAGALLGSAPTLRGLYEQIGSIDRTPETMIVKVLS